jgi:hypothetical protein
MTLTLTNMLRAIPLVAVALAPEIANASNVSCGEPYYDPCDALSGWVDISMVSTGKIPIDGVLVLQAPFRGPWDQAVPDRATVTVTADAVPFPGTLELTPLPGTMIWRPAAPWNPDALHDFAADIANPGAPAQCAAEMR